MTNPRQIFLLDGIGALVSSVFLGVILVRLEQYIGMPKDVLYLLAGLAVGFAVYSITCYSIFPKNWKSFLKFIAVVNSLYCLLTICLMIYYFQLLTILAFFYFVVEIIVILFVVRIEFKAISDIEKR